MSKFGAESSSSRELVDVIFGNVLMKTLSSNRLRNDPYFEIKNLALGINSFFTLNSHFIWEIKGIIA